MDPSLFLNPALMTPLGVLVIEVLLLLTGWLVPKWQVSNLIAENQHLRETNQTLTDAVKTIADSNRAQLQTSEIVRNVMTALQDRAGHDDHDRAA